MKYFTKIFILAVVFFASIYFFGSNMDEKVFSIEKNTMKMAEASLPTVTLRSDGVTCNILRGYTSGMEPLSVRENVISVETAQVLELLVAEGDQNVRKLQYKIFDMANGIEIAGDTINAFDKEDEMKLVRIKADGKMKPGQEYAAEVTLVTSESKRIYYYFRMKYYEDAHLAEKAEFIRMISDSALAKDHNAVIPYLESTYRGDGESYAHVDIKDSFFMVCWGNLEPKVITEPELSFTELYSNIAVATLRYMVELSTDTGVEQYYVTEKFRVTCTKTAQHLLNYDRTMEAVFDEKLVSLAKSQFKLGITNETDIEFVTNTDNSMLAFVRNKELWHYNLAENKLSKVFSFRSKEGYDARADYNQHDVRLLNLYESGDLSFMVSGYMNRGAYEGKTGVVLYRYYRAENRVEEVLYLPVNQTYQQIRQELGSFSYMNEYDVFYFMAYRTLYCYNLITQELKIISDSAMEDSVVFSRENGYAAWQEENDYSRIHLLHLETGERTELKAPEYEFVRLLGKIDENMLCAYGKFSDCVPGGDGKMLYPAMQVQITGDSGNVLKTYRKDGIYILGADTEQNSIRLYRAEKKGVDDTVWYSEVQDDYILNYEVAGRKPVFLTSRITELMFQEYYIALPPAYSMKEIPVTADALNTIIGEDTTVRISELTQEEEWYEVYSFGEIVARYADCAEAVKLADGAQTVGTVVNEKGKVVWERGVKYATYYLSGMTQISSKESGLTSRQAAVKLLLAKRGIEADTSSLAAEDNVKEFMKQYLKDTVLSLNGVTLDEALYFVYKGAPIFAMRTAEDAVVITGYNSGTVEYYDPKAGQVKTLPLKEAQEVFSKAGDIYLTYLP